MAAMLGAAPAASAATVSELVQRCAPHVAPRTALAIISVESGGRWWAVNDNDQETPRLLAPADAIAYARRRVAEGGSIDIGISQLNSSHLRSMHLTVDEAFEPCTNIAMGMSVLQDAWGRSVRNWGPTRYALFKAFEAYNGGPGAWTSSSASLRKRVEGYANTVWSRAEAIPFVGAAAPAAEPRVVAAVTRAALSRRQRPPHGVQVFFQGGQ
jgi:type IV secretion system protein VirB1